MQALCDQAKSKTKKATDAKDTPGNTTNPDAKDKEETEEEVLEMLAELLENSPFPTGSLLYKLRAFVAKVSFSRQFLGYPHHLTSLHRFEALLPHAHSSMRVALLMVPNGLSCLVTPELVGDHGSNSSAG